MNSMVRIPKPIYDKYHKIYSFLISIKQIENYIINNFFKLYFRNSRRTFKYINWCGVPLSKCPLDLWIYQEIIHSQKPDVIIECGTFMGGSALYLANICDLVDNGKIISIDKKDNIKKPQHKRVQYFIGSSTSKEILEQVKSLINVNSKVMVILDSDHHKEHVLNEISTYSKLVTKGNYLIVEDTCVNGNPILPYFGPGPMEAVEEFLKENKDFIIDKTKEKFLLTYFPNGFLKKIK